jgi:hypothetical protein
VRDHRIAIRINRRLVVEDGTGATDTLAELESLRAGSLPELLTV